MSKSSVLFAVLASATLAFARAASEVTPVAPSPDRPCSFATTAEVSSLIGSGVASAADERFRCKYQLADGWFETKLMDYGLKASRDVYEYNKARGKPIAGVGDQAYILGATLAVKLGDVVIVVDASNMRRPPGDAKLVAVARKIVSRIP